MKKPDTGIERAFGMFAMAGITVGFIPYGGAIMIGILSGYYRDTAKFPLGKARESRVFTELLSSLSDKNAGTF